MTNANPPPAVEGLGWPPLMALPRCTEHDIDGFAQTNFSLREWTMLWRLQLTMYLIVPLVLLIVALPFSATVPVIVLAVLLHAYLWDNAERIVTSLKAGR